MHGRNDPLLGSYFNIVPQLFCLLQAGHGAKWKSSTC